MWAKRGENGDAERRGASRAKTARFRRSHRAKVMNFGY